MSGTKEKEPKKRSVSKTSKTNTKDIAKNRNATKDIAKNRNATKDIAKNRNATKDIAKNRNATKGVSTNKKRKKSKKDSLFDDFTIEEIELLKDIFSTIDEEKQKKLKPIKKRDIVPVERWISDEYYVGKGGLALYPYWKKVIIDVFTPDENGCPKYNELILTGGIGIGKTTAGLYAMIRKLYELSCYENIPALFHLMPDTLIAILYFSVNLKQAELTGYGQIKSAIDKIPYFRENFLRNERLDSRLEFPENVLMVAGSGTQHAIGMNMIGALLDEANFFQNGAQDISKAQRDFGKISTLYTSIINRGASRFKGFGRDDSLCVLISSNTTATSFTEQRIKVSRGDPKVKVVNARLWEVKNVGTYSKETFFVFKGSDTIDPMICELPEDFYQVTEQLGIGRPQGDNTKEVYEHIPEVYKESFIEVPKDFKRQFENDIIQSLQDIAGISVASTGKLFSNRSAYENCITNCVRHPFTKEHFIISTGDTLAIQDYIRRDYVPLNRSFKRYIHIDQSLTGDCTGIACCYIPRREVKNGCSLPVVRIEWMLQINPPKKPKQISIAKIRDFIFFLRDVWQLEIGKVTYDTYASPDSIQIMIENGLNASTQSVDRTDEAYLTFINMIYDNRMEFYQYKPFEQELFELIHYKEKHKVDHLESGYGKDVSDAVVGAVFNAITSEVVNVNNADDVRCIMDTMSDDDDMDIFTMDELL